MKKKKTDLKVISEKKKGKLPNTIKVPEQVRPNLINLGNQLNQIQRLINAIGSTIKSCEGVNGNVPYVLNQDCSLLTLVNK